MIRILAIGFVLLVAYNARSQVLIIQENDTLYSYAQVIYLDVQEQATYIQWYQSLDSNNWTEITGANDSLLELVPTEDKYYYAEYIADCYRKTTKPILVHLWNCGELLYDQRDSASYRSVQIGTQCWMKDNLNIGTLIDQTGGAEATDNGVIEKFCFANDVTKCNIYGGWYSWHEMMQYQASDNGNPGTTQGICPNGWHLPSPSEWSNLLSYLDVDIGGKMKDTILWTPPNTGATNESGFSALPGGTSDGFLIIGNDAIFWTSSETSMAIGLNYYSSGIISQGISEMRVSVRCLKD